MYIGVTISEGMFMKRSVRIRPTSDEEVGLRRSGRGEREGMVCALRVR